MFEALLRLFEEPTGGHADQESDPAFALAALLIETARSDDRIVRGERGMIERLLARRLELGRGDIERLIEAAAKSALQAADLYHFTRVVTERLSEPERIGVIEMMWEVAYADGALTDDEDALIRRVAGLIYVSDRDRAEARRRVQKRFGTK